MPDLRCPLCPEVRTTRAVLINHLNWAHAGATWSDADIRPVDDVPLSGTELSEPTHLANGETHRGERIHCPGPDCGPATDQCACGAETAVMVDAAGRRFDVHVTWPLWGCERPPVSRVDGDPEPPSAGMSYGDVAENPVLCLCGSPLNLDVSDPMWVRWEHAWLSTPCTNPIPAAGVPSKMDRARLNTDVASVNAALDKQRHELEAIRTLLERATDKLHVASAEANVSTDTLRRATLNRVWDKLIDDGHFSAAAVVQDMIRWAQP